MPGTGTCMTLTCGLSTGTGTSIRCPFVVPARAFAGLRRRVVVVAGVLAADVFAADGPVRDGGVAFERDARAPDVRPDVARDVRAPDVFAPDARAPELLVPELCVRVAVPCDAVLVLVALPASAIPSH